MCRNIKPLFNFDPPATDEEVRAAALQFVRKVSGFNKPSQANEAAFNEAVLGIARASRDLIDALRTASPPRNRAEVEAEALERVLKRFPERQLGAEPRRVRSKAKVTVQRLKTARSSTRASS